MNATCEEPVFNSWGRQQCTNPARWEQTIKGRPTQLLCGVHRARFTQDGQPVATLIKKP